MGGGWSWGLRESKVCLPGRVGAAARSQGRPVGDVRWKEWGEENGVGAARGVHTAVAGPQKAPGQGMRPSGTGAGAARPPLLSFPTPGSAVAKRAPTPPSPSSRAAGGFTGKWLSKVARSPCTVLRGVPGWSLHVSLCISKAQSHPVCANHHN